MKDLFEIYRDPKNGDLCVNVRIPVEADVTLIPSDFQKKAERIATKTGKTSDYLMALSEWFVTYENALRKEENETKRSG